jgi:hypothetical protein
MIMIMIMILIVIMTMIMIMIILSAGPLLLRGLFPLRWGISSCTPLEWATYQPSG